MLKNFKITTAMIFALVVAGFSSSASAGVEGDTITLGSALSVSG